MSSPSSTTSNDCFILGEHEPVTLLLAEQRIIAPRIRRHRQARKQPDHRLSQVSQAVYQFGNTVFQRILLVRLEEGNAANIADRIAADETQIGIAAGGVDGHPLQTVARGLLLGVGKRLGHIDRLPQLASAGGDIILQ